MKTLVLLATLLAPTAAHAACDIQFVGQGGNRYGASDLPKFVEAEVRPRLSSSAGAFKIAIQMQCAANDTTSVTLTFDDTDYYITYVQDHRLTPEESQYRTSSLTLSRSALEAEIRKANGIGALPTSEVQNVVKTLAFFVAESARFSEVEAAAASLTRQGCSAEWLDYSTLLRRWSKISRLALHQGNNQWTARGGSGGNLVAPITDGAVNAYNSAISAGQDGPDAGYVDPRDWGKPIAVPSASCSP